MSTFSRLAPRLQEAIVSRLGFTSLRPVQELAGAALLDGENAVVLAPTAGGKTEASMFPTLSLLIEQPPAAVGALYIAPIKALLNNQAERLGQYTQMVGMDRFVWHGDATANEKKQFLKQPCELLMTTPESLEVMLVSPRVPVPRLFADLRMVVVDEVHALAGTDRGAHFMSVLERLARHTENDIQRVGLSATVGNPEAILRWLQGSSKRKGRVVDPPKVPTRREIKIELTPTVAEMASVASLEAKGQKSLFFCQSRSLTESVADRMRGRGIDVFVHHSSVSQAERAEAERNFHEGQNACIACTSTLELGIDVGDLNKVLQANAPSTVSSFLQRMGRTGRRKDTVANTNFYVEHLDLGLQAIALVELAKAGFVEAVPDQRRCFPVMVHQLLAMTLQFGAITPAAAFDQLGRVGDFADIQPEEFATLVEHMVAEGYLYETGGQLSMGDKAERVYGRKNFMELYAVFSSPVLYKVHTAQKHEIGSLEQSFVDSLVEDMSAFLLGGRGWIVEHINHDDRVVRVIPAPRGKKPSWGGFAPQMLSFELCQQVRRVLEGDATYPYVHPQLMASVNERRDELGDSLRRAPILIQLVDGKAHCWTFAGGRINHTLRYVFSTLGGFKVMADNFQLRLEGESVTHGAVEEIIQRMRQDAFWQDRSVWSRIMGSLPEYRLSKFQRALPPEFAEEIVAGYLLDVPGTKRFVRASSRVGELSAGRAALPEGPKGGLPSGQ